VPQHLVQAVAPEYVVEALIGKGGMGEVYRAKDTALDRKVALKVLPAEFASEQHTVDRFIREARIAAKLQHPNIVPIHAVGTSGAVHYFTMDLIDGESLTAHTIRHRDSGGLPHDRCRQIVRDIASGLDHAHSKGVVHRDLKPSNVMVESSGRVLVMDFGLAKAAESSQLTVSGAMLGTPRYMSPEQANGEEAGPASDIYSLGLIYFFLFAGDDLVQASSLGAVVAQHLSADLQSKVSQCGKIPDSDRELICRMIARDARERVGAASQVVEALATSGSGPSVAPVESLETEIRPQTPSPAQASPSPATPSPAPRSQTQKKARERMEKLLGKLDRSRDGDRDD
jgi:serine/threonine-protein kinase